MKLLIHTPEEMQVLGEKIAYAASNGELIELVGDVGAGKTTLTKGIAKGLGVTETVQSPSFTIFARYDASQEREFHHYDFYRLIDPGLAIYDLEESLSNSKAVVVVEWADHVKDILPSRRITIRIESLDERTRQVTIEGIEKI